MVYHIWSYPDAKGVKHCLLDGCTIRVRRTYAQWQSRIGGHWTSIPSSPIPECSGAIPTEVP